MSSTSAPEAVTEPPPAAEVVPAGAAAPPHILELYSAIQGRKEDKDRKEDKEKVPLMKRPAAAICEPEGGEGVVVGCSKCRWSVAGCAKCRDPDFAGRRWNPNA